MSRDCGFFRELMTVAEWLDEEEKHMLDQHVQNCPACRADADLMADLGAVLAPEALPSPPADLTARVMGGVKREAAAVRTPGLAVVLLLVLAGEVLWLSFLRGDLGSIADQAMLAAAGLWTEYLVPLATGYGSSLTGLVQLPALGKMPDLAFLWLPGAVTVIFLCLFTGGILYAEQRHHG